MERFGDPIQWYLLSPIKLLGFIERIKLAKSITKYTKEYALLGNVVNTVPYCGPPRNRKKAQKKNKLQQVHFQYQI